MQALSRLPRAQAIDGVHAFNNMRDELMAYLRPFAEGGQIVQAKDVMQFFEERRDREAEEKRRRERGW
jgi:E3 ubiquitin-protein ligase UBR7